MNSTREFINS